MEYSVTAELWALKLGLQLAVDIHCSSLCVELDHMYLAQVFINRVDTHNHHLAALFNSCRLSIAQINQVFFVHTHKEGNACADSLATYAHLVKHDFLYVLPSFLNPYFG